MIVPMKKYSFLVYHQDYRPFLKELQELGVLDILERETTFDDATHQRLSMVRELQQKIKTLSGRKPGEPVVKAREWEGMELLEALRAEETELEQLNQKKAALRKEYLQAFPWGVFSNKAVEALKNRGVTLRFFVCPESRFDPKWRSLYPISEISVCQSRMHFVVVQLHNESIEIDAEEVKLPDRPVDEVTREQKEVEHQISQVNEKLDEIAAYHIPVLNALLAQLQNEVDFKKAEYYTVREADDKLMILEGWVPAEREPEVIDMLKEKGIVYLAAEPSKTDKPPVLLRNNAFARLYEPIGNLFSLPDYREMDLTPFFAPFFMMFFGFCLGDAGYGLLLIAGATILKFRWKQKMRSLLTLIQWLGLGTVLFGTLTGTFFGIILIEVEQLGNLRKIMLNNDQAFNLALIIGLFQILVGTSVRAFNQFRQNGFVYALSPIGWILLLLGLLDMFLLKLTGIGANIILYAGLFLVVFFSDPSAGILARIGKGLWDLYGLTGIFGDVLSYIRLFALGVSSAILGFVVNDIALQLLGTGPVIGHLLFVVFLIFGHSLDLAISSLGAFVHPMRLTFVEFYKNSGFKGGGKKYQPFSIRKTN